MQRTTRTFKFAEFVDSIIEKQVDGYDYRRLTDGSLVLMGSNDYITLGRTLSLTLQLDTEGFDGVPKYI